MEEIMIIGIAGGTGSGKSTLTEKIKEHLGENITVIKHDNYYKRLDHLTLEERSKVNYDHPDAFETELLCEHIEALRKGESVMCPVYDFSIHNRSDKTTEITPNRVMIIEGILIFADERLRNQLDIRIFVDTDADERILRRILRDVKDRGRSLDSVINQYRTTVKPMHEAFVEPSKRYAHFIVPEGGENEIALNMIISGINSHLNG